MLKYSIAAAALLATSGFALADQMDHGDKGGGPNPAVERQAGPSGAGPAAGDSKAGKMGDERRSADDGSASSTKKHASDGLENKNPADRSADKADMKMDKDTKKSAKDENIGGAKNTAADKEDKSRDQAAGNRDKNTSSTGASEGTEGKSGPKGSIANVTSEQRTRVKGVFSQHHVEPARNLNVSINVGVALPRSVRLYPVPEDIVVIVPEYRGYEYVMLDDNRVAIIDPDTYEIVDIIVIA